MRAIVNISSARAAKRSGWRARAIEIAGKNDGKLIDILKGAQLADGTSLYDLIAEKEHLKSDFALYVNGTLLPGSSNIDIPIWDNIQIHVQDWK